MSTRGQIDKKFPNNHYLDTHTERNQQKDGQWSKIVLGLIILFPPWEKTKPKPFSLIVFPPISSNIIKILVVSRFEIIKSLKYKTFQRLVIQYMGTTVKKEFFALNQ